MSRFLRRRRSPEQPTPEPVAYLEVPDEDDEGPIGAPIPRSVSRPTPSPVVAPPVASPVAPAAPPAPPPPVPPVPPRQPAPLAVPVSPAVVAPPAPPADTSSGDAQEDEDQQDPTESTTATTTETTRFWDRLAQRIETFGDSRWPVRGWGLAVSVALAALICAMVPVGPPWLGQAGAVVVASAYSWALAGRTGGRPVVFGSLAGALGLTALISGRDDLATGAAVMTCVVSAVLAVMITVPARTFGRAVRECVIAVLVAGIGALATVGFEPTVVVADFEYATFGLALAMVFVVVYRLGAGLHGLGRRGAVIVLVGGVLVVVTVLYAELLRRYGTPTVVESSLDIVRWSRDNLGAFPRPLEAILGIPALAYGVHMRARRRQGWWVCAFGTAATAATANSLVNPTIGLTETGLSVLYGLVVGLVLGYLVIRLDLFLTGSGGGARSRGRRSRVDEEAAASRPEPRRTQPLR